MSPSEPEPVLTIALATGNRHKLAEFRALLGGLPIEVLGPAELRLVLPEVQEDGDTFIANAAKKARAFAAFSRHITLADDSGLEVDALAGRPGVRSARYAGEQASDAENNAKLLQELTGVEEGSRQARFRCALVLVDPWGTGETQEHVVEGTCEGRIALGVRGTSGFGYDPLFVLAEAAREGHPRTLAELSEGEKNRVSHRGRAFAELRPILERLVRVRSVAPVDPFPARQPV